jgi:hypothetical protein
MRNLLVILAFSKKYDVIGKNTFSRIRRKNAKFQRRFAPETPNSRNELTRSNMIRKLQVIKYYTLYQSEINVLGLKPFFVGISRLRYQNKF